MAELDVAERRAKEEELHNLLELLAEDQRFNQLAHYTPTAKQAEFHAMAKRERMLGAGNQSGKTFSAGMEVAMHMTGRYPDWWTGHRFETPIQLWISGVTGESTRDNPQRILLGRNRAWGTGTIPRDALVGQPAMSRGGVPDAVDNFSVRHVSGGLSSGQFKSYEKGREKWQGETLHIIWCDEEPPVDIYNEAKPRLVKHRGLLMITFTPLLGMTEVVRLFYEPVATDHGRENRGLVIMDIHDATFYDEAQRVEIEAGYSEAERRSRAHGLPHMGEGLVLPIADDLISIDPFTLPPYYRRVIGFDFGLDHPSAAVVLAHDPDTDTIYIADEYKMVNPSIAVHASAVKKLGGKSFPVAWPHDGLRRMSNDKGGAEALVDLYRREGVQMMPESARYKPERGGPQPLEPAIAEMMERFRAGRLKVFKNLRGWYREKANWFRKGGKPHGIDGLDDLMAATRYAVMMIRYARPASELPAQTAAAGDYNPLTWSPASKAHNDRYPQSSHRHIQSVGSQG